MANRWAVANGNWSAVSTWNGGTTLPDVTDDVYADGKTVTIDQSVTVNSIRNTQRAGGTAGGTYNVNAGGFTLTTTGGFFTQTQTMMTINASCTLVGTVQTPAQSSISPIIVTAGTTTITGTINSSTSSGTAAGIGVTGAASLVVVGNVPGNGVGNLGRGIWFNSTGSLTITGQLGPCSGVSQSNTYAVDVSGGSVPSSVTINGAILGGTSTCTSPALYCFAATIVTVNGAITGGVGFAAIFDNGILIANGALTASATAPAVRMAATVLNPGATAANELRATGPFVSASINSIFPFQAIRMRLITPVAGKYVEFRDDSSTPNGAAVRFSSADVVPSVPAAQHVRHGIAYGSGLVGALAVPTPNQVSLGVPVDADIGTAVLTPEAVWNHLTSSANTNGSLGERVKNCATVDSTGAQLAAFDSV